MEFEITPQDFKRRSESGEVFVLLDVREPWERELAQIGPSSHIPMADVPTRLQELDPDDHIVVYCHHGVRSLNVTAWLRQQGYERVQSLAGGIDRWSRMIDPSIPKY